MTYSSRTEIKYVSGKYSFGQIFQTLLFILSGIAKPDYIWKNRYSLCVLFILFHYIGEEISKGIRRKPVKLTLVSCTDLDAQELNVTWGLFLYEAIPSYGLMKI